MSTAENDDLDPAAIMAEHGTAMRGLRKFCESCAEPWPCIPYRLAEAYEGYPEMMDRLSALLTGVANALNGPPPKLTSWSWHDLPEKAQALAKALDAEQVKRKADL